MLQIELRAATKNDKDILFEMLNYNKFDKYTEQDNFDRVFEKNFNEFSVIIYKNIRIGMIFDGFFFINPLYWKHLDFDMIRRLSKN